MPCILKGDAIWWGCNSVAVRRELRLMVGYRTEYGVRRTAKEVLQRWQCRGKKSSVPL